MTKALTKVIFKPSTQSTDEFTIIVNPEEYKRWKDGGESIPLAEVVDSFEVFFSSQGAQGLLGRPSKQQLENVFDTSKDVDVVLYILNNGKLQASDGFSGGSTNLNLSRGTNTLFGQKGGSVNF
ncbi:DUF1960-domain-containing protein [Pluteus cervinus]|uniref:DUF1960-domain-containing protein n=1 Tax=Pluteus cervinus TaxID=181527 RepID=A0ACD3AQF9_9AGAR|nr:DUF1960-domain-containing protein [Pluteus cervinus]